MARILYMPAIPDSIAAVKAKAVQVELVTVQRSW